MESSEKSDKSVLERFFEAFPRNGKLLICTHNHPDPDSIASAAGLAQIAKALGRAETRVAYGGIIGRAENAHMVKALRLPMKPLEPKDFLWADRVAIVDSQPRTGNNALPDDKIPDLVIDHHPQNKHCKRVPFLDIRTQFGATASMITQYLFNFGVEIDSSLATALLYAIKSETQDLGREAFEADVASYLRLFPLANKKTLAKIVNSRVPRIYFSYLQTALQNAELVDTCVLTHLPEVYAPDIIPEVADLLMRYQRATWAYVSGVYHGAIYISIRTTNLRADAGALIKELVAKRGTGGGHRHMAGAKVDVCGREVWEIRELMAQLEQAFLRGIKKSEFARNSLAGPTQEV